MSAIALRSHTAERAAMASPRTDAAFAAFVGEHGARLVRFATLLCGNRYDAEDAVQEALISVGAAWSRVRPETAAAYARTAVARKVIDLQRRRRELLYSDVPETPVDDLDLLRFDEDRAFFARLRDLPTQQRAVLVLRYYADLDDRQIAKLLHCGMSTVRSQAARALAKLRDAETREADPTRGTG
jgi:RNA polymerase sigma-70 factor (sigma-E family)